jgi:TRAP-type C4-dicarboxylate transport system permease large subunit
MRRELTVLRFLRRKRPQQFPLTYRVFLVAVWLSFAAAGGHYGGLPLAIAGLVVGIVVGLGIMLCWAADENGGDSPEQRRATFGRMAKWFGWSAVAIFVLMAIFVNVAELEVFGAPESCACLGVFVACVVAWVILKALSLPN